jgi:hypothetical protein
MNSVRVLGRLDRNVAWNGNRLYQDADFRAGSRPPYELRGPPPRCCPALAATGVSCETLWG